MDGQLVITRYKKGILSAMYENNKLVELNFEKDDRTKILGNIYIAKVKNIVKNINSAFIEIQDGVLCYYSLVENKKHIFLNSKNDNQIAVGDEILVQISEDSVKTKNYTASCNINLTGKYLVLTASKCDLGISRKIKSNRRKIELKNLLCDKITENYGLIIRTNSQFADNEIILKEANTLKETFEKLLQIARYRSVFQCIYKAPKYYLEEIRDQNETHFNKIITNDKEIFEEIKKYLEQYQNEDLEKLEFYNQDNINLETVYSLNTSIEQALNSKVWLNSGAYLVIEHTEAMVVIDVNTGKAINKNNREEHFYNINLEASKEIARQIRLRNLSGIIIIDFINMKVQENKDNLLIEFGKYLKNDHIKSEIVDMTGLNLVEVTRQKVKRPFHEQIK